jgi:ADP-ribosylglycohydrolase
MSVIDWNLYNLGQKLRSRIYPTYGARAQRSGETQVKLILTNGAPTYSALILADEKVTQRGMNGMTMNRRDFIGHLAAGSGAIATVGTGSMLTKPAGADALRLPTAFNESAGTGAFRRIAVAEYQDRVLGAFLGKIVGTIFGFPFEGRSENVVNRLDRLLRHDTVAPVDDDYYYEMVAVYGFERHGIQMTIEQLGDMWKEYQAGTWGSSQQARLLLEKGIKAPQTGEPRYNQWFHTIGPQFSSGTYGMITAGMVNLAGEKARYYSHVNGYAEGCDGAVFVAACTSEAFFETNTEKIVRQAAQLISPRSNYRKAIDLVLEGYARNRDWRELANESENLWRPDYPQLNNSVANGALCALALLYGKGDWLSTVNIVTATDDFTDADCNADVVSSVVAAMHGSKVIPQGFVQQLHDRIHGTGMGPLKFNRVIEERISAFAERISAVGRKMLLANGAREESGYLLIPQQQVKEQPLEWFDINDYAGLWSPGWQMAQASRGGPGNTYLQWETDTLVTFPRDTRPCRLERQLQVPAGKPSLRLQVGSVPGAPWRLQVFVDDDALLTQIIIADSMEMQVEYQDVWVDLSQYAGQNIKLRLYHWLIVGGVPGSAYWRSVEVLAA